MNMLAFMRKTKGWTQAALAKRVNVHRTTITLAENGLVLRPNDSVVRRINTAFGTTLTWGQLMESAGNPPCPYHEDTTQCPHWMDRTSRTEVIQTSCIASSATATTPNNS